MVSVWKPLLDARYAGVMWLPLFALAGAGLAALPRRAAAVLLAAVGVAGLMMSVSVVQSGTTELLPGIEARVGAHDLVEADPSHYLVLLVEGSPSLTSRLHVIARSDLPWYVGTAVYPRDAVLPAVPADVTANGGRIFYVGDPGSAPALLPPAYREQSRQCVTDTCLVVYGAATER